MRVIGANPHTGAVRNSPHTPAAPRIHIKHQKGVFYMANNVIDDRATRLGEFIVENKATVRRAAKQFGVSKSTVHTEVTV